MSSPVKLNNPYPFDHSPERAPYKSLRVDIPKELNSVERRAFELNKQFSQSISEMSAKPIYLPYDDDTTPWDYHKMLIRRADDYSQYLMEQNSRSFREKQEAVSEVNSIVKRTMGELDIIREEENKGLGRKIADHNKDFGRKVKELEKSVAKQIEKIKVELMENIRREENESEKRIAERSKKLVDETIPSCTREGFSRQYRPQSAGSSPIKTSINSPEKKMQSNMAMRRLEESREKIKYLY
jgi:hypothetical protein